MIVVHSHPATLPSVKRMNLLDLGAPRREESCCCLGALGTARPTDFLKLSPPDGDYVDCSQTHHNKRRRSLLFFTTAPILENLIDLLFPLMQFMEIRKERNLFSSGWSLQLGQIAFTFCSGDRYLAPHVLANCSPCACPCVYN